MAGIAAACLALPATAGAAPPAPFGHPCVPQSGVMFCPTASDDQRVPSFDGVPLDVDVTLPATGDGPFPTIVFLHGFGADKTFDQAVNAAGLQATGSVRTTAYHANNVFYAHRGYAVVNYSARGFGRSCGRPDSRTSPACDRGWLHLADQRYEARDTQHLLGLLVDQGVAQAGALGVTGTSYGAGQTLQLARLRNRVRRPDGSLVPWRSPNGTPLAIGAAWSRWGWSDLVSGLTPNGRARSHAPGVKKQSFVDGLFLLAQVSGFVAPPGADPTADPVGWKTTIDRGEPYGAAVRSVARELSRFHSMTGITGGSVPLLAQSGWRDELFPGVLAPASREGRAGGTSAGRHRPQPRLRQARDPSHLQPPGGAVVRRATEALRQAARQREDHRPHIHVPRLRPRPRPIQDETIGRVASGPLRGARRQGPSAGHLVRRQSRHRQGVRPAHRR